MMVTQKINGQTVRTGDFGLEYPVYYSAKDSIIVDVPKQIVRLYGESQVKYDEIDLKADYIEIDIENSEVTATYSTDSSNNPIGKPVFTYGTDEVKCEAMKYNFKSEKAYITEVRTQQGEGYIHMAESKRLPNQEMHFRNGKYTTCDKEKPHFHFQLSKAIVIPEKRIVTGPIHMRILNIPLPIAAPFAFLPNSEKKKHGILLPEFRLAGVNGSGLENLGYYIPLSPQWETYIYGSIFTTGRWGLKNRTNYVKKYKNSGTFEVGFERLKGYFFEETVTNNYTVFWRHNQSAKAHPSLSFGANIDFRSNNNAKQSLEIIPDNVFSNSFNSAITLGKSWKFKSITGIWGSKVSLQQNSNTKNYIFELPSFNFTVNSFDLGVLRKSTIGKKWYENIRISYSANSENEVTVVDSIVNQNFDNGNLDFLSNFNKNGLKQNAIVQTNLKPKSGWFTFNLTTNYTEIWNFQSIQKLYNEANDTTIINDVNGFQSTRNVSFGGGLSTNVYGYLKTKFKSGLKFKHVMSPNVSFTYRPDLGSHQEIQLDTLGTFGYYSPFDQSLYKEASRGESGVISYNLGNTFEMKKRNKQDTINNEFKSVKILERFSVSGSYDLMKDSLNLSNFRFSAQTRPLKFIMLQSSWTLNPYEWVDSTGITTSTYAWNANKGIGRITNANFGITGKYAYKADAKTDTLNNFKNSNWSINFAYNINFARRTNGTVQKDTIDLDHTLRLYGNVSLWKLWSIDYDVMTDLLSLLDVPNPSFNLGIKRELHCWEASINFRKNGNFIKNIISSDPSLVPNYSLQFKINIKSSMFNAFLPQQNIRIPGI